MSDPHGFRSGGAHTTYEPETSHRKGAAKMTDQELRDRIRKSQNIMQYREGHNPFGRVYAECSRWLNAARDEIKFRKDKGRWTLGESLQRGPLTIKEGILPTAEVGKTGKGYTRMQVQNYYTGQRNLGLSIRDAMRGTEFALNLKDLQTDSTGNTVVHFAET